MANKFKSADQQKKVAPGGGRTKPSEIVVTPTPEPITAKENPLEGMIEQKPEGKSYGFYLSTEAAEKLEKLAKQNKCSKSKALDTLLKNL